jgi:hypothetical protein
VALALPGVRRPDHQEDHRAHAPVLLGQVQVGGLARPGARTPGTRPDQAEGRAQGRAGSPGADGHGTGAREGTRWRYGRGALNRGKGARKAALEEPDCAVTALGRPARAPPLVRGIYGGEPACRPGLVQE